MAEDLIRALVNDEALKRPSRAGLWALVAWAALLLAGTLSHQPDYKTDFSGYARYITKTPFLISHLVASITGSGIGILGAVALFMIIHERKPGLALSALITFVLGNVMVTSVFGAAAYAQPAIGRAFLAGHTEAVAINSDVYGTPIFVMAGTGILLFSAGTLLFGLAIARSQVLPKWAGIGIAVFGPMFSVGGILLPGFVQTIAAAGLIACSLWLALASGSTPRPDAA